MESRRRADLQQRRAAFLSGRESRSVPWLRCRQATAHLHTGVFRSVLHDRAPRYASLRGSGGPAGTFFRRRDGLAEARSTAARAEPPHAARLARGGIGAAGHSLSFHVFTVVERRGAVVRNGARV